MKARFVKRPIGKVLSVWCAFATLATSTAPAFATAVSGIDIKVLPNAQLNGHSGNITVTPYGGSGAENVGTIASSGAGGDAVLDWGKLNIGSSETLNFNGGVSFYNVVSSAGGQSELLGALNGNDGANVYIFNPSGILIGGGAKISVEGIFGAYAMGIESGTLNNWIANPATVGAEKYKTSKTELIDVRNGAQIKAAVIDLAGKGISLENATFDGPTTLTSGGTLVLEKNGSAGTIAVAYEVSSFPPGGIDLMGTFTDALTVKAAGDVKVAGKTAADGDVKIEAEGSITENEGLFNAGAIGTVGKLTASSENGSIQLKSMWNSVDGEVSLTAKKGDVSFFNGGTETKLADVTAKNVSATSLGSMTVKGTVKATEGIASVFAGSNLTLDEHGSVKADNGNASLMAGMDATVSGVVEAKGDVSLNAAANGVSITDGATLTATKGNVDVMAKTGVSVAGAATVEAGKAVSLKSTGTGDITIDGGVSTTSITAKDGAVGIDAAGGSVTVNNATITAKNLTGGAEDLNGAIGITAQKDITISGAVELNGQKDIEIATRVDTGGAIEINDTAQLLAGGDAALMADGAVTVASGTAVTADGNVALKSTTKNVTVGGTVAANGGNATLTATKGSVAVTGEGTAVSATGGDVTLAGGTGVEVASGASVSATATEGADGATVGGDVTLTATSDATDAKNATIAGSVTADKDITVEAANAVSVTGNALVEAGKAVTLKSTTEGDVTIDGGTSDSATVTAKDGAVTIAANGAVTVNKATVTAKNETGGAEDPNGKIDIGATKGVAVSGTASLNAAKNLEIATTAGNVTTADGTSLTADGDLVVNAVNDTDEADGIITIAGTATVKGKTDLDAKGAIVANNTANDFQGLVDATSTKGSVTLVDANSIQLNNIDAKGDVSITAKDGDVTMAKEDTSLKAGGTLAVTAEATTEGVKGDITLNGKTEVTGATTLKANGSIVADNTENNFQDIVDANAANGSVTLVDKDLIQPNDIDAKTTVDVSAENIEVVANDTPDTGVNAGEAITFTATKNTADEGSITVNNTVVSTGPGDITFTASDSVTIDNAPVRAEGTDGNVVITATDGAITVKGANGEVFAKGNVTATAKTDVNVSGSVEASGSDASDVTLTATEGAASISGNVTARNNATIKAGTTATLSDNAKLTTTKGGVTVTAAKGIAVNDSAIVAGEKAITLTTTDGNVTTASGTSLIAGSVEEGDLVVNAANNTEEDDGYITINGTATVTGKTTLNAKKNIVANNVNNDFQGNVDAKTTDDSNGSIELADKDTIKLNDIDAGTTVSVKAQNIEVVANEADDTGVNAGGAITFTATEGVTVKNEVTSEKDGITFNGASVTVNGAAVTAKDGTGNIVISATGGNVTTDTGSSLTAGGDLVVGATAGNITLEGTATVAGKADLDANGSIVADNEDNDFKGLVDAKADNGLVTLVDKDTIQLNNIDAKTAVDVTAKGGKIEVVENGTVKSADSIIKLDAKTGASVANNATLDAKTDMTIATTDGDVTTVENSSLKAGGTLTVTAKAVSEEVKGDITLHGKTEVVEATVLNANGSIVADNTDNNFQNIVDATATGTDGSVKLVDKDTIKLNDIDAATTVSVTAKNIEVVANPADDAGVNAGEAITFTATDAITVNNEVTSEKDGITFDAGTSVSVNNATVTANGENGNVVIDAGTDVTVSGTVAANGGNAELTATKGKITVNGTETAVASVSTIGGDVKLSGGKGVEVAQYGKASATAKVIATPTGTTTVGGNVELTAMSDDAALAADEKNVVIAGRVEGNGDITVKAKNDITVNATGSVLANKDVSATAANNVTVNGSVEADKAVTLNSTGTGNITVEGTATDKAMVTANDGKVTIDADNGAVTINNANVTATGADGNVAISATDDVTVNGAAQLNAAKDVSVATSAGAVDIIDGAVVNAQQNVTVEAAKNVQVLDNAAVTAGKAVTLKSMVGGDVKIDTANSSIKANGGAVTIAAANGAVAVKNTAVTAAGADGTVAISATKDVTVNGAAQLNAAKDVSVATSAGAVAVKDAAKLLADGNAELTAKDAVFVEADAEVKAGGNATLKSTDKNIAVAGTLTSGGDLVATAANGDITIEGTATVAGKADLDASGSIVADNEDNDFKGLVDATATDGSVELVGKNTIKLNDVDAKTTVSVEAKDIEVVASSSANAGVNAGEGVTFNADNSIAVNNAVDAKTGNVFGKAANGSVTFGANGTMTANEGSVLLAAAKNIDSANKSSAVLAKDTIVLAAGEDIGSPLNVNAPNLKVVSGGSADITMKKGEFNESGDLAVNGSTTSIETGKDLDLTVEGNLSTTDGGVIKVGNNLDLAVNSTTPEIDLTLGGDTIRATDKTQDSLAIKLHGGNKYPKVIGTDSGTAVLIDGRLAGGDSAYYSILGSYEAQAALGMTPDIRGAKADEAPVLFRDKNQNVIDVLPNTWDEQFDDAAVVPEEAKASDAASKVARR